MYKKTSNNKKGFNTSKILENENIRICSRVLKDFGFSSEVIRLITINYCNSYETDVVLPLLLASDFDDLTDALNSIYSFIKEDCIYDVPGHKIGSYRNKIKIFMRVYSKEITLITCVDWFSKFIEKRLEKKYLKAKSSADSESIKEDLNKSKECLNTLLNYVNKINPST